MNQNPGLYYSGSEYFSKLERALATMFGLEFLRTGLHTIRDSKGWRDNEQSIQYIWLTVIARSSGQCGGLFGVKYNANKFRNHPNPAELVEGIFTCAPEGMGHLHTNRVPDSAFDVNQVFNLNLINASPNLTLGGVSYTVGVYASNTRSCIQVSNPSSPDWNRWQQEMWNMGRRLAAESNNPALIQLLS